MRRPYLLIFGACIVYSVAWFLPVVRGGVTFPHGLPGWEAFRLAASAVWPIDQSKFDDWYVAVLSTISAVTTLLFVPALLLALSRESRALRRVSAWVATSAFVVNAHWYVLFGSDRKDLRIGYFLWWLSFLLLALSFLELSRQTKGYRSEPSAG
jgi:hypothetical protein